VITAKRKKRTFKLTVRKIFEHNQREEHRESYIMIKVNVKQSSYRPAVAQRVTGS